MQGLTHEINDVLLTDASDAPRRLGNEQSELFDNLKWAAEVRLKLEQGLEQTLRDLRQHCNAIANLPNVALLAALKDELSEALALIAERLQQADFYRYAADFSTSLTTIRARIRDTVIAMQDLLKTRIKEAEVDLKRVPEWSKLTQQEQTELPDGREVPGHRRPLYPPAAPNTELRPILRNGRALRDYPENHFDHRL